MTEPKKDALDFSPAVLGKEIVNAALDSFKKQRGDAIVHQVKAIMERLELMKQIERKTDRRIELLNNQLKAVNDGEFSIDNRGNIKFNDDPLNVDWGETERW